MAMNIRPLRTEVLHLVIRILFFLVFIPVHMVEPFGGILAVVSHRSNVRGQSPTQTWRKSLVVNLKAQKVIQIMWPVQERKKKHNLLGMCCMTFITAEILKDFKTFKHLLDVWKAML